MTINFTPSNSHRANSWIDKNRVFKLRLNKLKLGDALICKKSGWSVMCMVEGSSDALYIIYKDNVEMLRRKRPESLLQYLVNNTPDTLISTLVYVEGGAIAKMKSYTSDYTIDDYNDFNVDVNNIPNNRKFVFVYLLTKDIFKRFQNVFSLDIYRVFFPQASKSF